MRYKFSEITPEISRLAEMSLEGYRIDPELYTQYDVKRGLRDINGNGVVAGLTNISTIKVLETGDGMPNHGDGKLYYRGIDVEDIVAGFIKEKRFGFEETVYLLLFGKMPSEHELAEFRKLLADFRELPSNFMRDVIMKAPTDNMMNTLAKSVLALYSYDDKANDISIPNVLRQSVELITMFPVLSVYAYHAYDYARLGGDLFIHSPRPDLSIAENILYMLRDDGRYSELEARILDLALVLHAEHGGGNNSTFTVHVVSSSGTDTYSAIAAALGSLKGPKHGGANIKVAMMFDDMKQNVSDWTDEEEIKNYLRKLLHKEAFDHAGLIYGMGHAVYSQSDPRAKVFKSFVESLSSEKGRHEEFALYSLVERLAPEVIAEERRIYKGVCANVDFYSGFVYRMLGIPDELFTPLFATSRIAGWSAHRIEELINSNKIIRPAYKAISPMREYTDMENRMD
ncbi:citrate/2-methylcitrate synthase [Ruminococcus sp.]|uniref:citrate/2-methylcitrate synthase n=1 Tax=Ruminococcus sp. TaxID=41978 RepID=UPI002CBB335D|nr:citrate/2-methylcitrate synthase [Ruminococcus sp.]HOA00264.1 citrate/2-methylcitrate synthase [Ruminococcus sp.]HOH86125.1 citrate/2-methylcitrate synthase [Ruminococcus sp.]